MFRARTKTGISPLLPLPTNQPSHGSVEEVGVRTAAEGEGIDRPSGVEGREGRRATTSSHRSLPLSIRAAGLSFLLLPDCPDPSSEQEQRTDGRTDGRFADCANTSLVSRARIDLDAPRRQQQPMDGRDLGQMCPSPFHFPALD